jgi:hypothetical protein
MTDACFRSDVLVFVMRAALQERPAGWELRYRKATVRARTAALGEAS